MGRGLPARGQWRDRAGAAAAGTGGGRPGADRHYADHRRHRHHSCRDEVPGCGRRRRGVAHGRPGPADVPVPGSDRPLRAGRSPTARS